MVPNTSAPMSKETKEVKVHSHGLMVTHMKAFSRTMRYLALAFTTGQMAECTRVNGCKT